MGSQLASVHSLKIVPARERSSGRRAGGEFGVCYSPQFIALGSVIRDFLEPDLTLLGELDERSGSMLEAAYRYAMNDGSHVLEVMGFPQNIRQVFLKSRPYFRRGPNLSYYFRAGDSEIQSELQHADAWYACPFDGDASL